MTAARLRARDAATKMPAVRRVFLRGAGLAAVIFAGWTLVSLFFMTQQMIFVTLRGVGVPLEEVLLINGISWALWLPFIPLILWSAQFVPMRRSRRGAAVAGVLAIVLGFAALRAVAGSFFMPAINGKPFELADVYSSLAAQAHANITLIAIILAAYGALVAFRHIREKDRRALTLETQLARAQLEQLRGQLQPHFLFNAINGIAALVHTNPGRADEMLMELAALLRSTLDLGRSDTIPLRRELELLDHYVRIQTMRFHDRLHIRRTIDATALGCAVPALLLQPLVENSIRHVVAQRPAGGNIEIRARREADRIVLRVTDDGPGFDPAATTLGVGISNTIARVEQLYRGEGRIDFVRGSDGFSVVIDLPVRECA